MKGDASLDTTILSLDSHATVRTILCEALQNAGYMILTAPDLGAAVDRLDEMKSDLLIIAPYISGMSGQMAADYLRSRHPGLPVLVVAGLPDDDRVNVQNSIRHFHVFPQPFSRADFVKKVRDTLDDECLKRARETPEAIT